MANEKKQNEKNVTQEEQVERMQPETIDPVFMAMLDEMHRFRIAQGGEAYDLTLEQVKQLIKLAKLEPLDAIIYAYDFGFGRGCIKARNYYKRNKKVISTP